MTIVSLAALASMNAPLALSLKVTSILSTPKCAPSAALALMHVLLRLFTPQNNTILQEIDAEVAHSNGNLRFFIPPTFPRIAVLYDDFVKNSSKTP